MSDGKYAAVLCHGEGMCELMKAKSRLNDEVSNAQNFPGWSPEKKNAGKHALAFMMTAVTTGHCPSCNRRIRS
jgi:hypothetical protein